MRSGGDMITWAITSQLSLGGTGFVSVGAFVGVVVVVTFGIPSPPVVTVIDLVPNGVVIVTVVLEVAHSCLFVSVPPKILS
jgi:hypothetical protein